jgi:hypothetical protein
VRITGGYVCSPKVCRPSRRPIRCENASLWGENDSTSGSSLDT